MRTLPILIAGSCFALATPGLAQNQKSVSVQVNSTVGEVCTITSPNSAVTLTTVDAQLPVVFTYRCNFIGAPTLSFQSQFGGIRGDAPGNPVLPYAIYLNDSAPAVPPSAWQQSTTAQTPASYGPAGTNPAITSTVSPNVDRMPDFRVALREAMIIAGNYTDTLTVSIAP